MCTAASLTTRDHYFGRTLDLDHSYGEGVVVTPRNYPFHFAHLPSLNTHYALIGMAVNANNTPLYFDATNEAGLSMAGLNFPGNAFYFKPEAGFANVCTSEFIPYILAQAASVAKARKLLENIRLTQAPGGEQPTLHWMIADRDESIVVESMKDGLHVYDNPAHVMTNNPPFPIQLFNLNNYMNLSPDGPKNNFAAPLDLKTYCLGMGAMGLPGDPSSMSRFVKVAFTLFNSKCGESESESISQFFHILGSVCQERGVSHIEGDRYEYTLYTSCCNTTRGIYYYNTYENSQISAVDLHRENLDGTELICYPKITGQQIRMQN